MSDGDIREWYLALPDSEKLIALALISSHLTIHGRSFGIDLMGEKQIRAFKGLNELQHKLSGHIVALGIQRDRYPDDVLWNILQETATLHGLHAYLMQSFEFAWCRDIFVNRQRS